MLKVRMFQYLPAALYLVGIAIYFTKNLRGNFPELGLLDFTPNLGAAFAMPWAFLAKPQNLTLKQCVWVIYSASLLTLVILILEEFHPIFAASKVMDIKDIIASVAGVTVSLLLFEFFAKKLLPFKIKADE